VETNQIIDKVESGEFTKDELISIAEACTVSINLQNHRD
jgi:hypothetical protein